MKASTGLAGFSKVLKARQLSVAFMRSDALLG